MGEDEVYLMAEGHWNLVMSFFGPESFPDVASC